MMPPSMQPIFLILLTLKLLTILDLGKTSTDMVKVLSNTLLELYMKVKF